MVQTKLPLQKKIDLIEKFDTHGKPVAGKNSKMHHSHISTSQALYLSHPH